MPGPLAGTKIIEIAGIGPGPFCAMMLADMGADVIRVDRAQNVRGRRPGIAARRRADARPPLDRRRPQAPGRRRDGAVAHRVGRRLIEGFRPGVMERLGLGPDAALGPQPAPRLRPHDRLGPGRALRVHRRPRHQLHRARRRARRRSAARAGRPSRRSTSSATSAAAACSSPSAWCAASCNAQRTGEGQVVDAAMVDGCRRPDDDVPRLPGHGHLGGRSGARNLLDTGAHFYDVYETADGKYVSIGSIEPQFYAELLRLTGLEGEELPSSTTRAQWPAMKERIAAIFKTKTRDEWCAIMEGTDVCFAPVLSLGRGARSTRTTCSATRSSSSTAWCSRRRPPGSPRTPVEVQRPAVARRPAHRRGPRDWGFDADRIAKLRDAGAVA